MAARTAHTENPEMSQLIIIYVNGFRIAPIVKRYRKAYRKAAIALSFLHPRLLLHYYILSVYILFCNNCKMTNDNV